MASSRLARERLTALGRMGKEERRLGRCWVTREKASEKSKWKEYNQRDRRGQSLEPPDRVRVEQDLAGLRKGDKSWSDYGCCCQPKNMLQ